MSGFDAYSDVPFEGLNGEHSLTVRASWSLDALSGGGADSA